MLSVFKASRELALLIHIIFKRVSFVMILSSDSTVVSKCYKYGVGISSEEKEEITEVTTLGDCIKACENKTGCAAATWKWLVLYVLESMGFWFKCEF